MDVDEDKIDQAVLALMYLTLHDRCRVWKGFHWDALDRLYEEGMIGDPKNKAKSVWLTDEGLAESERLFKALFCKPNS
jgi:hypothetical protein